MWGTVLYRPVAMAPAGGLLWGPEAAWKGRTGRQKFSGPQAGPPSSRQGRTINKWQKKVDTWDQKKSTPSSKVGPLEIRRRRRRRHHRNKDEAVLHAPAAAGSARLRGRPPDGAKGEPTTEICSRRSPPSFSSTLAAPTPTRSHKSVSPGPTLVPPPNLAGGTKDRYRRPNSSRTRGRRTT